MTASLADLTGTTWGCWTVIRDSLGPDGGQRRRVWCRCSCGAEAAVIVRNLIRLPHSRCKSWGCTAGQRARRASA